ncbi:MAG: hypothetical protein JXA99_12430 [Candidatus Lokiarchaeota archaeon]|nr:hypothetical protein [Candidatus Lokiarchaeota archaeon]
MLLDIFNYDPIEPLKIVNNSAIKYFLNRDILEKEAGSIEKLWNIPEALSILKIQRNDGSWEYPPKNINKKVQQNYNQLETYRQMGILVEKYGFNNKNVAIQKAADFLFNFQTAEGDFRGIYGKQYSPNYSAGITEILIKAGYESDPRIEKSFNWLLSLRHDDGGWAIPIRTNNADWLSAENSDNILKPIKTKPSSHLVTGIILRTFAAHPYYKTSQEAKKAGELLASRFFIADKYPDRRSKDYWFKVSFPFWFTDIISSLDSLVKLDFDISYPNIQKAIEILKNRQIESGLWDFKLLKSKDKDLIYWISLKICMISKKFFRKE